MLGLFLLCVGLTRSFGGLSPLGELLAPSSGIWRHSPTHRDDLVLRLEQAIRDAGLPKVEIEIDEAEVPHLKSTSEVALYFAQGYVTSYYRLWQMDFLSRITAGRVAEILGEKALPIDRFFRRMRIPAAARASAVLMINDPVTSVPLAAYTRGVNARIAQLDVTSMPIEYRLFGIFPDPWSEDRAAYLLKFMTWELTGYLYDFQMTASKAKLSHDIFEILFPLNSRIPGTILSDTFAIGHDSPRGESYHADTRSIATQRWPAPPAEVLPEAANGSNSWAVPARLMSNQRALLANDLHLGYALPALWFSIQLTSPTMNVYGASLPGAPGVIVGFTESMGWAVTNGSDDVLDWYSLRFRDVKRQEYYFENSWRPVITRDEVVKVAGGPTENVTTRQTHVGPIVFEDGDAPAVIDVPSGLSVQWIGHTPSNELRSFLLLNRATTARDCTTALIGYVAPSQNFVCADRTGQLLYLHAGIFPDRKQRDGRFIFVASSDADLWQGTLPAENNPSLETSTDLVITANQAPFNGANLYKYGWFFAAPYRALQIRKRLDERKLWKPEQMIELQGDTGSWLAKSFKRIVLREAETSPLKEELSKELCGISGSGSLRTALQSWRGEYSSESVVAPLMHEWLKKLKEITWTRVIGPEVQMFWPSSWRFFELMEQETAAAAIWDGTDTSEVENLSLRLAQTLAPACENLKKQTGRFLPTWNDYQNTSVRHAGRIPGLGRTVRAGGAGESIFANKGQHGPTWKMIVTFEDQPRAWTMMPGGQSGDPASRHYDDLLEPWARGEMRSAKFNMRSGR
jgi:penicillin amidase